MAEVLPSINRHYKDFDAVATSCNEAAAVFEAVGVPAGQRWVHFDVADGLFTFHKSWNDPERLKELDLHFSIEAHLMVDDPRAAAERWLAAGARRLIIHVETVSLSRFAEIADLARAAGAETALALNPETMIPSAAPYFALTSRFTILGVHPGLSGQKFLPAVLEKIALLRREMPEAVIEIDGGMNPQTARAAIDAGADRLVSESYLFGNADEAKAFQDLQAITAEGTSL